MDAPPLHVVTNVELGLRLDDLEAKMSSVDSNVRRILTLLEAQAQVR
jgi:hypothetical protein